MNGSCRDGADSSSGPSNGGLLSPFHIAALAFQRARQLKEGARPRVEAAGHSSTRLALLEVLANTISWTVMEKTDRDPDARTPLTQPGSGGALGG